MLLRFEDLEAGLWSDASECSAEHLSLSRLELCANVARTLFAAELLKKAA